MADFIGFIIFVAIFVGILWVVFKKHNPEKANAIEDKVEDKAKELRDELKSKVTELRDKK